jgi:NAD(P)-dependent dehydrogenase (short-subunit alcohol dehydrogenase family)
MRAGGRIVNISSVLGGSVFRLHGLLRSKHGVIGFHSRARARTCAAADHVKRCVLDGLIRDGRIGDGSRRQAMGSTLSIPRTGVGAVRSSASSSRGSRGGGAVSRLPFRIRDPVRPNNILRRPDDGLRGW